ncbi:MAG TPA: hypothetical protein VEV39_00050 [Gemmatimonadales bacterium]|nr:hypothetical protein [Gemmatimonadales bacterium]
MHRPGVLPLLLLVSAPLAAQSKPNRKPPAKAPADATATASAAAAASPADSLNTIRFRNLGPSVAGGRVSTVVGVPGQSGSYYVGAGAGGVWKTTDNGNTWDAIFKDQPAASIGAVALAPSNPNLVWVGTGEAAIRNDVVNGHGVWFSPDAGHSWRFMGLGDVGQISKIVVDPANPDIVLVAALGHAWSPNADRGIFRTTDGGKTWQKTLFVNDTTGASDLIMDPGNPRVYFAGLWQFVRHPWELVSGGTGSGIYRSTDGGVTWERLSQGLPKGIYGRIALGIGASNPSHVYALVEAKTGMLWESRDLGDHWSSVSDNHALDVRPFYFSQVTVSPADDRKLYFSSYELLESDDGGKTARAIDQGVHVDHHALWIDPTNADRIIQGNDGGAYATTDGGKNWTWFNNLPIEQFYMVAATTNDPYMVCGGLQDNNGWCGPAGASDGAQWFTVTGGDGEYAVPAPSDTTILYVDSQNGSISRVNLRTGESRGIRPYEPSVEGTRPSELTYRFNWTSPIEVSATNADEVFIGANVVFKSTDGGQHWAPVSPDLTRNDKSKQVNSGGPIEYDISGAETYNTILTVNVAPTDTNVIWVGTDDGLVQVTKDGGKTWANVGGHFPGLSADEEGRIYQVGVSPFDAGTAYITYDRHEFDDNHAYAYKTADYGKTWTRIDAGLPEAAAHVVREDPNARNFLMLGTDQGLWMSRDGGASWKAMKADFPTTPVYDVKFVKASHDLLVATHGRGLFALDDITPLEGLTADVAAQDFHLFPVVPAILRGRARGRSGVAPTNFTVRGTPQGAVIDYYLKAGADTTPPAGAPEAGGAGGGRGGRAGPGGFGGRRSGARLVVTSASGDTVFVDSSGPTKMGVNRMTWALRWSGPAPLTIEAPQGGEGGGGFRRGGFGPPVVPGTYTLTVSVAGKSGSQTVDVRPDPVQGGDPAKFQAQLAAGLQFRSELTALHEMLNHLVAIETQIRNAQTAVREAGDTAAMGALNRASRELSRKLRQLKDTLYNSDQQRGAPEDDIHYLTRFADKYQSLGFGIFGGYAQPPSPQVLDEWKVERAQLDGYLATFNAIVSTDVAAYNQVANTNHTPVLLAGAPVAVKAIAVSAR